MQNLKFQGAIALLYLLINIANSVIVGVQKYLQSLRAIAKRLVEKQSNLSPCDPTYLQVACDSAEAREFGCGLKRVLQISSETSD